jgi:glutamate:GABA antiporter
MVTNSSSQSQVLTAARQHNDYLSVTRLILISLASIISIRSLPMMASTGMSLFFFYLAATIFYLIPSTLIYAELVSALPIAGGIYAWSRRAFGEKTALVTVWTEWFNNIIGVPTSLSFLAAAFAYIINPALAQHKFFMFTTMLVVIWAVTFLNFFPLKKSTILNALGAWMGILIPGALLTIFGLVWLGMGYKPQISFSLHDIFPPLELKNFVFLLGVFSSYAGMQILGFHVKNVRHPQSEIPRAMVRSTFFIVAVTVLGALSIAVVVPRSELNLVSSVYEGFSLFLNKFNLGWALYIVVLMIIVGSLSSISSWLNGPARAFATAAQEGIFPRWLGKENCHGMPVNVLLMQAMVASVLSTLFLYADSLSAAFWMLMALTSQYTLVMDILIFASVIKLRYSEPELTRPFKIAGGNFGVWMIAGFSILVCVITIGLGFIPPAGIKIGSLAKFETIMIVGNVLYIIIPFIIYRYNKRHHHKLKAADFIGKV